MYWIEKNLNTRFEAPYDLTNAIIAIDRRYKDCFLLHSTITARPGDEFLQILYGNKNSIMQQPNSVGHCISADAKMSKRFADFFSHRNLGLRPTCKRAKLLIGQIFSFWDSTGKRYIYNLVTKERSSDNPDLSTRPIALEALKSHAGMYGVSTIAITEVSCGFDQMNKQEVVKL